MTRYVALFRGINVGKAKRIAMADLRALLESLGCANVRTLQNSGNAVFDARVAVAATLAATVERAVADRLGVRSLVVVKSAADLESIVDGNALLRRATDPSRLVVAFTRDHASLAALAPLASAVTGEDALHVGEHAAYAWCASGLLESPLTATLQRALERCGTTRNWGTTQKLRDLASG